MPDEPDSHPSSRVPHDIPSWRDHAALVEEREERRERLEVNVPKPGSATAKLASFRDRVQVPDYHLIRRIGSGAYGEVWLAQSITGALRAVKIVWREDFEFEKTFHREFEGIQQFEPISRGHPGLVQVLHVGWNEEHGFYYYVMELADDAVEGPHISDLSTYAPRTLSSDMKHHGRLDLHFCQEAGAFIADALHYMHEHGLTHRDIKPSNIIYCGGVCKLADIGLVAVSGERSFVGTEGFVPPEGPGTPQADLYSLGKVLYEMSSGKDRMEFPEVPDDLGGTEWPFWLNFNHVICRACAPDLTERYQTCADFAHALRTVSEVQPPTLLQRAGSIVRKAALLLGTSCMAGGAWASYKHQEQWAYHIPLPGKPPPPSLLPEQGKPWKSVSGVWFSFKKDRHLADRPVDLPLFNLFLEATMRPFEGDVVRIQEPQAKQEFYAVVVPETDATEFCEWMTKRERKSGRLPEDLEFAWKPYRALARNSTGALPAAHPGWTAFLCEITKVPFGKLALNSTPSPAQVFEGETLLGTTPLYLPKMRAGAFDLEIRYPGYKPEILKGALKLGESRNFNVKLKNISAVIFGKPWENTLKMKLVPLGQAMLGATEVRRRDFREFVRARKLPAVPERLLEVESDLDKPMTFVSRSEAMEFCDWLTGKEQAAEIIEGEHRYRLPADDEWSMAANLPREKGESPADRHLRAGGIYPWGFTWPPVPKPGNLFDESAAKKAGGPTHGITGYNDGQEQVSAVGAFKADWRGVFDLSGNVWEWVQEDFGGEDEKTKAYGTTRGGGWKTFEQQELLASYRRAIPANTRSDDVGFRVILAGSRPARDDE
jgi:serine/threonine protein kinase/formylglycine-generating enzyme required for sulfatase activity